VVCSFSAAFVVVATGGCSTGWFGGGTGSDPSHEIRRIAILPFAYRDASGIVPCNLCPDDLVMAETSREDALLVTAFFHEAMTTYPRFATVSFDTVERFVTNDMRESMERLWAVENVDAVLVGGLLELRPRLGDPRTPTRAAGAAVYAALVEASTGKVLWVGFRDDDQEPPSISARRIQEIVSGESVRWRSDLGQAQYYATALVRAMTRTID
jgi:hypothetical protein